MFNAGMYDVGDIGNNDDCKVIPMDLTFCVFPAHYPHPVKQQP